MERPKLEDSKKIGNMSLAGASFDYRKHLQDLNEYIDYLENELSKMNQSTFIRRFNSEVFVAPFRLGKKQKRAILDAKGREVIIMPHNDEKQTQMYCDYLNGL